jgi:hypothetical protein
VPDSGPRTASSSSAWPRKRCGPSKRINGRGHGHTPVFAFSRQSVAVNHYYFYVQDRAWGPAAKAKAAQAAEENETRAANAQKLVVQAKALASSNNVLEALNKLRDARMLSPQAVNLELESSLVDQARNLGEAALARARFLDVNDNRREEALKEFERAAQFLDVVPGGHPGLAYAKQRVTELKSGR